MVVIAVMRVVEVVVMVMPLVEILRGMVLVRVAMLVAVAGDGGVRVGVAVLAGAGAVAAVLVGRLDAVEVDVRLPATRMMVDEPGAARHRRCHEQRQHTRDQALEARAPPHGRASP